MDTRFPDITVPIALMARALCDVRKMLKDGSARRGQGKQSGEA